MEGTVFTYFIDNYIAGKILQGYSTMTIGGKGVKQYANLPNAKLHGTEIAFKWKPAERITISSLNTYTKGVDNHGLGLPSIAPYKIVNAIDYSVKKGLLRIEGIISAPQRNVSTEMYGETETPGFTILNLYSGIGFKIPEDKSLRLSAEVENLLNQRYFQHFDLLKVSRPGRNIAVRATILF